MRPSIALTVALAAAAAWPSPARAQAALADSVHGFREMAEPEGAVAVAGTQVRLTPPPGFVASRTFHGFVRSDRTASIEVQEVGAPVDWVLSGFGRAELARRGIYLRDARPMTVGGRRATLLALAQRDRGVILESWVMVIGDQCSSATVTATYPAAYADRYRDALKTALLSVTWAESGRCLPPVERAAPRPGSISE